MTVGSGAKITRTDTTAVTATTSIAGMPFPEYFDTVVIETDDIAADPETGKFTVTNEGWYDVKLAFPAGAIPPPTSGLLTLLFKNGDLHEIGDQLVTGGVLKTSWTVYLEPGDFVQPGYKISAQRTNMFGGGDPGAVQAYFTIAQLNG